MHSGIQTCHFVHADDKAGSVFLAIAKLKSSLAEIIEPDFGLLNDLLATNVLTRRQIATVRSKATVYERNDALLDLLTVEDQCKKFVEVLPQTKQEHVANYITHNGSQKHHATYLSTV